MGRVREDSLEERVLLNLKKSDGEVAEVRIGRRALQAGGEHMQSPGIRGKPYWQGAKLDGREASEGMERTFMEGQEPRA